MMHLYFNIRFELKKLSEMSEEDLREVDNDDDSEHELAEALALQDQDQVENTDQSDDKVQHVGTARSITASKILKANLAC